MKALKIPTGENVLIVPIKDRSGSVLSTVYIDTNDTDIIMRCQNVKKLVNKVCKRVINISINADGSPASLRYTAVLITAERDIKRAIKQLLPMDNPDGLLEAHRPFASIGGKFYCTRVIEILSKAIEKVTNAERT